MTMTTMRRQQKEKTGELRARYGYPRSWHSFDFSGVSNSRNALRSQ